MLLSELESVIRSKRSLDKGTAVKLVPSVTAKPSKSFAYADDPEQAGIEEWASALPDDDDDDFGYQSN